MTGAGGDLGCHGHPYLKTPNIDRLAKEGTDFHRFTVASGVCSPSRTAVMTGHFPARYNIDGHFAWVPSNQKRNMPDWLDTKAPLLPRFLQQSGYATAHYANGLLYFSNRDGKTIVIKPGKELNVIAENTIDGTAHMASITPFQNSFLLRSEEGLYRIGKK